MSFCDDGESSVPDKTVIRYFQYAQWLTTLKLSVNAQTDGGWFPGANSRNWWWRVTISWFWAVI